MARPRELNCNRYSTVQLCTGERDLLAKMMRCGCEEEWRSWVERKVKRDATRRAYRNGRHASGSGQLPEVVGCW